MTTAASLDAYRSHELSIQMKTSSGDMISLNFQNNQSLSMSQQQHNGSIQSAFSFRSMQAFSFEMQSNGLNDQDKKEIDAFMKQAQPYIDNFIKELSEGNQTTPVNKVASKVTSILADLKNRPETVKNYAKNEIAGLLDNAASKTKGINEKMIEEAQKLMKKISDTLDSAFQPVYA